MVSSRNFMGWEKILKKGPKPVALADKERALPNLTQKP